MTPEQYSDIMSALKSISENLSFLTGMVGAYFVGKLFGLWK